MEPNIEVKTQKLKDNFLGEKPLIMSPENQKFVNSYLSEVKKRSDKAYKVNKSTLKHFLEHINKSIPDITKVDIKHYFDNYLDKKVYHDKNGNFIPIRHTTKETQRANLRSFFSHIESIFLDQDKNYFNPVPSKKVYKFKYLAKDIKKQSESNKEIFTKKQLLDILNHCKRNLNTIKKKKYFIFYGLLECTGARPSEILSIKIEDINLHLRYFETGFEKNARKSTLRSEKSLMFFFPKNFKIYLENYILTLHENEKWLFPMQSSHSSIPHLTHSGIQYTQRKIQQALGFHFNLRFFRNTLITEYTKQGCPDGYREGLMNHAGQSVEWEFYIKLEPEERRDIYEKYFPYYEFPYF